MMNSNAMLAEVLGVPAELKRIFPELEQQARAAADMVDFEQIRAVYLYGCGDSWAAALGSCDLFTQVSSIYAAAFNSMQASRYTAGLPLPVPPQQVLTIGVSYSGKAARTLEATLAFQKQGCHTFCATAAADSPVAQACEGVIKTAGTSVGGQRGTTAVSHDTAPQALRSTAAPDSHSTAVPDSHGTAAPAVQSYANALLSLYLFTLSAARRKRSLTKAGADKLTEELYAALDSLEVFYQSHQKASRDFAALVSHCRQIELLGAGSVRGAAEFGVAKIIEAVGIAAVSQDLEEFAHVNYFRNEPGRIPTVIFTAGNGRSVVRCRELMETMKHLGRPYLVISDRPDSLGAENNGPDHLTFDRPVREYFAPLLYSCAVSYITAFMDIGKENEYYRGHRGPWKEDSLSNIQNNRLVY